MKINPTIPLCGIDPHQRAEKARAIFKQGYNCCQAVVLAFSDLLLTDDGRRIQDSDLAGLTSGFGGGMGRMREVCGTVSGMTFMAGVIAPAEDPQDRARRSANYALVQKFASEFRSANGSIICRELLSPSAAGAESPVPQERNEAYYRKRPCDELVACAAAIVAERLAGHSAERVIAGSRAEMA